MKSQKNRGLGGSLHSWLCSLKPGTAFTLDSARNAVRTEYPEANRMAVGNALTWLSKKGLLHPGDLRGTYVKAGPKDDRPTNPAQAIYDLLDFMAKAEPSLKRAAKILEAVDGANQ